jgi:hypothetical protein
MNNQSSVRARVRCAVLGRARAYGRETEADMRDDRLTRVVRVSATRLRSEAYVLSGESLCC